MRINGGAPVKEIALVLGLLCLFACTSDKQAEQSVPNQAALQASSSPAAAPSAQTSLVTGPVVNGMSLALYPADIYKNTTVSLIPKGFAFADAEMEWLVNGQRVQTSTPDQFAASSANKGDKIQVRAMVKGTQVLSNIAEVKNSPPQLSGKIKLLPEVFKPGDVLSVEPAAVDPDGDEVTFRYEWTKNGEPAGTASRINSPVKRDDKVTVRITPCDRDACGATYTMNAMVRNMPPVIAEGQALVYKGNAYTLQFKATDPDGDTLTYSLKNAPQGMTIDSATGFISWPVPAGFKGKGAFTVSAKDPSGGEATQVFNYDIGQ